MNPTVHVDLLLPQFQLAGETLRSCDCNNSHSGNLSVRVGDRVIITRTGSMLACLSPHDLVETPVSPEAPRAARASSELPVHLAIYEAVHCNAIAHGHAIWAVLAGFLFDELRLIDVEGCYYHDCVPVVEAIPATASVELGEALAGALKRVPVAVVRAHGVFAVGDTLEQAMQRVCSVNDSARLLVEAHRLGLDIAELHDRPYLVHRKQ